PAEKGRASPAPAAEQLVIDQRNETFVPFVTLLHRGDTLVFTNSDRTRHHVYSFASIKQFAFVLNPGEKSPVLKFEQAGIAAIGCNIHDRMIAYAFVTDATWAIKTDLKGHGTIANVPKGTYRASVWHPRMDVGSVDDQTVSVDESGSVTFS